MASCAHGSAVPSASASSPVPEIFAFSRSGAPHAPVAEPSNCAGPSPAAIVRSSPSSASKERPCSDDSFDSMPISLRPSASRSMPWIAARRLRGDRGDALELRRVEIDHGARIGAIGLSGVLVEIEREFRRARGPGSCPSHRAARPAMAQTVQSAR